MFWGRTLHCAAGTCLSGRDLTAVWGNVQPFQHKMLPSCVDNTSFFRCSQNYESSVKYAKFTKGHFRYFTLLLTSHVIKHPVITYSEKCTHTLCCVFWWFCYRAKAGAVHSELHHCSASMNTEDFKAFPKTFRRSKVRRPPWLGGQNELQPQLQPWWKLVRTAHEQKDHLATTCFTKYFYMGSKRV